MKIPPPPVYTSQFHADGMRVEEGGAAADANVTDNHRYNYNGCHSQPSLYSETAAAEYNAGLHSESAASARIGQQEFPIQQHDSHCGSDRQTYEMQEGSSGDRQCISSHHAKMDHLSEQSLVGSFGEGVAHPPPPPSSPPSKATLIPNMISLAQKFIPTVMKRLDQHSEVGTADFDDFEGMCSPLGSPAPTKNYINTPQNDHLKTSGMDENDFGYGGRTDTGDEAKASAIDPEAGIPHTHPGVGDRDGDGDGTDDSVEEYLPRSAALLVSALQGSARKIGSYQPGSRLSADSLPSLIDDVPASASPHPSAGGGDPPRRLDFETQAEAILESMRSPVSGRSFVKASLDGPAAPDHAGAVTRSRASTLDDDDSIGGEVSQLNQSIANLQRDLENVEFDDIFDDGFGGAGLESYGGESGILSRMRRWFSRGMIMEQKLLHTYVHHPSNATAGIAEDGGVATGTNTTGRYSDNPVLVWSLALMWAFVVIIMMHPKISEMVEGGDPGQLADFVAWLFDA